MADYNEEEAFELQEAQEAVEEDIQMLESQIETLTVERNQLQEQVMRTLADFQNFRKRTQQETATVRQFANLAFVDSLLPVLDNFERTVQHIEAGATPEAMLEGIRAVERQLRQALEAQNVKRIESIGKPFDPVVHEALGSEPSEEFAPETVIQEIEPGYTMGDRVVRPARVKVAQS